MATLQLAEGYTVRKVGSSLKVVPMRKRRVVKKSEPALVALCPFGPRRDVKLLLPGSDEMTYEGIMTEEDASALLNKKYPNHQIMDLNDFFVEFNARVAASGFSTEDRARLWR